MAIRLNILFFGATAEIAGTRSVALDVAAETRASDIFTKLVAQNPKFENHRLHLSVNQQYASGNEILNDGDEVAIFTAVSGG